MTKFNSDLLRNDSDTSFLRSQFPDIADGVSWDELGQAFDRHERQAVRDKKFSTKRISAGVGLIVLSLLVTLFSTAPAVRDNLGVGPNIAAISALVALLLLFLGALLARAIISGERRDDWLRHRMIAERLRQLNFQFLASNVHLLCSRGVLEARELESRKAAVLEDILFQLEQGSYLQAIVDDASLSRALMTPIQLNPGHELDPDRWQQFRRYYETLRLGWQEQYARSFFGEGGSPFRRRGTSLDRYHASGVVLASATTLLFLMQSLAVATQLFDPMNVELAQLFVLGASASTIVIFGANSMRNAGAISGELTRYRHYLSHIEKARRYFAGTERAEDIASVLNGIREMEEAAYFEMREFILLRKKIELSL